ncbi:MAG: FHA domain-containing protein [Gammaproteobacteria bacterium]|jgi:pSer/pThr/pTyr-binding forkhead associated (FHA) protein|nr:FHA domain-containing protein [Gammaproteobacteria bacterium]
MAQVRILIVIVLAGSVGFDMKIAKIELDNGFSIAVRDDQLPLTIGRSKSCDIRISEPFISRFHCELFLKTGRTIWLKDLSTNGTRVNNRTVAGESVPINRRSAVSFAADCCLTVIPTDDSGQTLVPF